MERVDVDGNPATFDSSSARLTLPDGARVLFAGLYSGARTTAGTRGKAAADSSPAALVSAELKLPGHSGYERLGTAGVVLDQSSEVPGAYQVLHDITGQVRRAGSGIYTVANVQASTGEDRYAGWALVVAFEAPSDPPRNLTVFDGLRSVTQGRPAITISVRGFQTPVSGPVRTRLGFAAYEGDRGISGDSAALNGHMLSDSVNPANNFFNGGVSIDGRPYRDKTPDFVNQLGFDAKLVRIDGLLANGATDAEIGLRTANEQYLPGAITFATDLYAPVIRPSKSVINVTRPGRPAEPGDTLRYSITYTNDGLEAATNFIAEDQLPAGTTYLPGSLRVSGAASEPSDIEGDDLAEYDARAGAVRFFLGSGASPGRGGTLAPDGSPGNAAAVSFEARVDPSAQLTETEIVNSAQATFVAPTLGKELSALSLPTRTAVAPAPAAPSEADLALMQHETLAPTADGGGDVVDAVTVTNHGPDDATAVQVTVKPPAGSTIESATSDAANCVVDGGEVTCTFANIEPGGSTLLEIVEHVPAGDVNGGAVNTALATAQGLDLNPGNNSTETTAALASGTSTTDTQAADLTLHGETSRTDVQLGKEVQQTVTVRNVGPGDAAGVELVGSLSLPAQVLKLESGAARCTSGPPILCTISHLPAGAELTLRMRLRPLRPGNLLSSFSASSDRVDRAQRANSLELRTSILSARASAALRALATSALAGAGERVRVQLTISARRAIPALGSTLCVRLPAAVGVAAAPGARTTRSGVCWDTGDLRAGGHLQLQLVVKVGAGAQPGQTFSLLATLTGTNFPPARAIAAIQIPQRPVACTTAARASPPTARIAC